MWEGPEDCEQSDTTVGLYPRLLAGQSTGNTVTGQCHLTREVHRQSSIVLRSFWEFAIMDVSVPYGSKAGRFDQTNKSLFTCRSTHSH